MRLARQQLRPHGQCGGEAFWKERIETGKGDKY